jgi:epoxyqueuosine reductase
VGRADNQSTPAELTTFVKQAAARIGFEHCAITDTDLGDHETHLLNWLRDGFHGSMQYMQHHGTLRSRPCELVPGTIRIISVRLDYYPPDGRDALEVLNDAQAAYISRYALGRDYHKLMRKRLQRLAEAIEQQFGPFGFRAFTDSAPVLEKAIAEKAGHGWIGKHSNLLSADAGSWFFLGELFTDLPLATDPPQTTNHCGSCTACMQSCPTQAIVAPYRVDARRCISYLTIERKESIPVEFRKAIGNRIYGCDDCQLVCPFNKFSSDSTEDDFRVRHQLDDISLVSLFAWSEQTFKQNMVGSAIYRIGYECWLRNIAVALGNAETSTKVLDVLRAKLEHESAMVREHVQWALAQHTQYEE